MKQIAYTVLNAANNKLRRYDYLITVLLLSYDLYKFAT